MSRRAGTLKCLPPRRPDRRRIPPRIPSVPQAGYPRPVVARLQATGMPARAGPRFRPYNSTLSARNPERTSLQLLRCTATEELSHARVTCQTEQAKNCRPGEGSERGEEESTRCGSNTAQGKKVPWQVGEEGGGRNLPGRGTFEAVACLFFFMLRIYEE